MGALTKGRLQALLAILYPNEVKDLPGGAAGKLPAEVTYPKRLLTFKVKVVRRLKPEAFTQRGKGSKDDKGLVLVAGSLQLQMLKVDAPGIWLITVTHGAGTARN